jgi:hypothetical protein
MPSRISTVVVFPAPFLYGKAKAADSFDGDAARDVGLEQAFDGDDGFRHE